MADGGIRAGTPGMLSTCIYHSGALACRAGGVIFKASWNASNYPFAAEV
jgi:hypothetical protein